MDGWFNIGKAYYYAKAGVIQTNTVIEGYKLDGDGKNETKSMVIELVNQHTKPTMSNQEKINALFNWLLYNDMPYIRNREHLKSTWVWKDSWVDDYATDMYKNWGGNCFRYASLLGLMVHEATGLDVKVCRGYLYYPEQPHGWIVVYQDNDWYMYDVELVKHGGVSFSECWKVRYSDITYPTWYYQQGEIKLY